MFVRVCERNFVSVSVERLCVCVCVGVCACVHSPVESWEKKNRHTARLRILLHAAWLRHDQSAARCIFQSCSPQHSSHKHVNNSNNDNCQTCAV